jgi:hypothetical protein
VAAALGLWQRSAGVDVKFAARDVDRGGVLVPIIVLQFWRRGR